MHVHGAAALGQLFMLKAFGIDSFNKHKADV
jgi:hypothetical protein